MPIMTDNKFNNKVHLSEVPVTDAFLTLLAHKDDVEIVNDQVNTLEIGPEQTLAMAAKFNPETWAKAKVDPDFVMRLRCMFPDIDLTEDRPLSDYAIGVRHVVGLIIMTNMAINTGRRPFWKFPETYLHPASQAQLADLAISYQRPFEDTPCAADQK